MEDISSLKQMIQSLQMKNNELTKQLELKNQRHIDLQKDYDRMRGNFENQKRRINQLILENENLKEKLEKKPERSLSPCLKRPGSPPKSSRVNFSQDLTEVVIIDECDSPSTISKTQPESSLISLKKCYTRKRNHTADVEFSDYVRNRSKALVDKILKPGL